jgi:maleylacetate reductase
MNLPDQFSYIAHPARVIFGAGVLAQLPAEVQQLGAKRVLVLCTPEQIQVGQRVQGILGDISAGLFDRAVMHVPIETALAARDYAQSMGADGMVAVGGGSTIGLAKAIALVSDVPIIAVPTTYAGSEMTPIYGITEAGVKKTGRDLRVLPRAVLYDPELSATLPLALSVTSGINAIAHAAEALYAHDGNPIIDLMAQEGIRAISAAIPALTANTKDMKGRSEALYGAWLCGAVLGAVSMGLHHKLCHTLGGSFNLPHAQTHTVVLAHTLAYNSAHAPRAMQKIAAALGSSDAARGVFELARQHGAPTSLKALGLPESGLDRAAELAVSNQYPNPRPLEKAALRALLQRAFDGALPQA